MGINREKASLRIIRITLSVLYPLWKSKNESRIKRVVFNLASGFIRKVLKYRTLSAVSHEGYCNLSETSLFSTIRSNRVGYCGNMVYNESDELQRLYPVRMNDLRVYLHKNVYACGNSDVLVDNEKGYGINDFCYNKEDRLAYGDGFHIGQKGNLILTKDVNYKKAKRISKGILISGLYSHNYYHAFLDNLIRLLVVKDDLIDREAVLIVDNNTIQIISLNTIFKTLTKDSNRDVVVINEREALLVDNLYYISHINSIITNMYDWSKAKYEDYTFDFDYMKEMRNKLVTIRSPRNDFPKRFLLSRKNIKRRSYNEEEVLNAIKDYGFEAVSPEEYSFEEQVALFNNAEFIIGGSGAAFTNLLFCKEKTKVLIITRNKSKYADFPAIAYMNGCDCHFYCALNEPRIKSSTSGFNVNIDDFMKTFHIAFDNKERQTSL